MTDDRDHTTEAARHACTSQDAGRSHGPTHSILTLVLHRSPAPTRIQRFFRIRQKSGSEQNSAGARCYYWMLKMCTSNANSIFRT